MTDLVMLGATGHLRSIADSVNAGGLYRICGILDDSTPIGTDFCGWPVTGRISDLSAVYASGCRLAFISAGSIGGYGNRKKYFELAISMGFEIATIIDPSAVVAGNAKIGRGVFIGKRVVVNSYAEVGEMAIINTGAIIEHNDCIAPFANIAPGCVFCGGVTVGEGAHVGAGTTVLQTVSIGKEALVGIGSVVTRDIPAGKKAYGCPCRVVGEVGE